MMAPIKKMWSKVRTLLSRRTAAADEGAPSSTKAPAVASLRSNIHSCHSNRVAWVDLHAYTSISAPADYRKEKTPITVTQTIEHPLDQLTSTATSTSTSTTITTGRDTAQHMRPTRLFTPGEQVIQTPVSSIDITSQDCADASSTDCRAETTYDDDSSDTASSPQSSGSNRVSSNTSVASYTSEPPAADADTSPRFDKSTLRHSPIITVLDEAPTAIESSLIGIQSAIDGTDTFLSPYESALAQSAIITILDEAPILIASLAITQLRGQSVHCPLPHLNPSQEAAATDNAAPATTSIISTAPTDADERIEPTSTPIIKDACRDPDQSSTAAIPSPTTRTKVALLPPFVMESDGTNPWEEEEEEILASNICHTSQDGSAANACMGDASGESPEIGPAPVTTPTEYAEGPLLPPFVMPGDGADPWEEEKEEILASHICQPTQDVMSTAVAPEDAHGASGHNIIALTNIPTSSTEDVLLPPSVMLGDAANACEEAEEEIPVDNILQDSRDEMATVAPPAIVNGSFPTATHSRQSRVTPVNSTKTVLPPFILEDDGTDPWEEAEEEILASNSDQASHHGTATNGCPAIANGSWPADGAPFAAVKKHCDVPLPYAAYMQVEMLGWEEYGQWLAARNQFMECVHWNMAQRLGDGYRMRGARA